MLSQGCYSNYPWGYSSVQPEQYVKLWICATQPPNPPPSGAIGYVTLSSNNFPNGTLQALFGQTNFVSSASAMPTYFPQSQAVPQGSFVSSTPLASTNPWGTSAVGQPYSNSCGTGGVVPPPVGLHQPPNVYQQYPCQQQQQATDPLGPSVPNTFTPNTVMSTTSAAGICQPQAFGPATLVPPQQQHLTVRQYLTANPNSNPNPCGTMGAVSSTPIASANSSTMGTAPLGSNHSQVSTPMASHGKPAQSKAKPKKTIIVRYTQPPPLPTSNFCDSTSLMAPNPNTCGFIGSDSGFASNPCGSNPCGSGLSNDIHFPDEMYCQLKTLHAPPTTSVVSQ